MDRLSQIRQQMAKRRVEALILTDLDNIRYASGFSGSTATVIVTPDRAIILVDSRYVIQAGQECPGFEVVHYTGGVLKAAASLVNEISPRRLGFEGDHISYADHRKLRTMIVKSIRMDAVKSLVEEIRYVKDSDEIEKIKRAVTVVEDAFSHIIEYVKPGMTEQDVALEIDTFMRRQGAKPGFETIVATGPNAAIPHHQPTGAVIERGHMLKMDFGALLNGYNSDLTRTIFLGEPDAKQREVYDVVLEAQMAAIRAIRPGIPGREVDAVAREYIKSKGYGDYFGHGLGHSLGIAVHDGPGLSPSSEVVLQTGMVMTVEPGVYIEGWGGVRIEDDVVVTEDGFEDLMSATKDIVVVR